MSTPEWEGAARLREAREERGWTQNQAAKALGISKEMYCKLEYGERRPSWDLAAAIKRVFGLVADIWLRPEQEPEAQAL